MAREVVGSENVAQMPRPSMGSEDFAAYLEQVPGSMFRLGCAGEQSPWPGLHTPTFDVDEKCLPIGAKILARTIVELSKP
jgi:amidohydrolase